MKRLALILLLALFIPVSAQNSHWEVGLNSGWMSPNGFSMLDYAAFGAGVDVAWLWQTPGNTYWMQWRRQPSFGLKGSFEYVPDGIAGSRIGLVGLLRAPLWGRLDYNIGIGLSAFNRTRYIIHDQDNIFISSLLCCLIDIGFVYNIGERLQLSASFVHSSNGNLVRPNKGLNFMQLGFAARLGEGYKGPVTREGIGYVPFFNRHEVGFTLSPGGSMSRHTFQPGFFFDYDISLNYCYYIVPLISVGATVDLWYNGSHDWQREVYHDPYPVPMYVGMMGTIEGHWGALSIKAGVGPQLFVSSFVTIPIYERLGAYYNWGSNYVGVAVNAHAAKAEFIEWSYGRRFPIKSNR